MGKPIKKAVAVAVEALAGAARYESLLSDEQLTVTRELVSVITFSHSHRESMPKQIRALVLSIFPVGREPTKADWVEFVTGVAEEVAFARINDEENATGSTAEAIAEYVKKVIRAAYREGDGSAEFERELPSAGEGKDGAKKQGSSPKKSAKGLQSRVLAVVKYVEGMDTRDINPRVVAKIVAAADALGVAADAFAIAVNE